MTTYSETYFEQVGGPIVTLPEFDVSVPHDPASFTARKGSTPLADLLGRALRPSPTVEDISQEPSKMNSGVPVLGIIAIVLGAVIIFKLLK